MPSQFCIIHMGRCTLTQERAHAVLQLQQEQLSHLPALQAAAADAESLRATVAEHNNRWSAVQPTLQDAEHVHAPFLCSQSTCTFSLYP